MLQTAIWCIIILVEINNRGIILKVQCVKVLKSVYIKMDLKSSPLPFL